MSSTLLLQAAQAAAGAQQYPAGALYVVATPIGNLADMSLRAVHVLSLVDHVACEDTRHSAALLRHLGLHKPLLALHQHNEAAASGQVIEWLAGGRRVACVSDAGTPGISDPGARLVAAVQRAGHRVMPIPGPSSVAAAISVAGDALAHGFCFAGFLPARGTARHAALQALVAAPGSQVLLEAPHRMAGLADELAACAGVRRVTLCRELTKQFETVHSLPAADLPAWLAADAQRLRGEFVVVLHAPDASADETREQGALDGATTRVLQKLLAAGLPLKQAVALTVDISGAPRNQVYAAALALRDAEPGPSAPLPPRDQADS
jgi:16S rRNA (cytidine1402-2'-O)-methyltransferase